MLKLLFKLFLVVPSLAQAIGTLGTDGVTHYNGYTVLRLVANTRSQLKFLHDLAENNNELDFWTQPTALNTTIDVMVPPNLLNTFEKVLLKRGVAKQVMINDVEQLIEKQKTEPKVFQKTGFSKEVVAEYWTAYQRLAAVFTFLESTVSAYPAIAAVETIGRSTENRELRLIRIGVRNAQNKPAIFLNSAIHAREWISPAVTTYLIQTLVDGYGQNNADIVALLQKFDFLILPVTNPDGYEFSHTTTRLWRKTRGLNSGSTCIGTDGNRNFEYYWGGSGSSNNPCSETYRGAAAFDQPETRALADYILANKDNIVAYFDVHSYSQLLLYPWGWTSTLPADNAQLLNRGNILASTLQSYYGTTYRVGSSTNVLYAAAGNTVDWNYGVANNTRGVKYSYTIELRDTGANGFLLPVAQIVPSGIETVAGFIEFFKAIFSEF